MYRIVIEKRARRFLEHLPRQDQQRIVTALEKLPDAGDIKALREHTGMFRLRVGEYRVIYTVDHGRLVVCVVDLGNRGQIYNRY